MSSYPNVYGFCDAGCRRRVPTYEEFVEEGYNLNVHDPATDDYVLVTYTDDIRVHEEVTAGLYMVRVACRGVGLETVCSFMFDFSGNEDMFSCQFQYDGGKGVETAVVMAEAKGGGDFILKVVPTVIDTATESEQFKIWVRQIGSHYAVG